MKIVNLVSVLLICFYGSAVAQNNFSFYTTINHQPTDNINAGNLELGANFIKKFNSKYEVDLGLSFNSHNLTYFGENYSDNFLNEFDKLKSVLSFSYANNPKYKYHFRIEPFIASENHLELSSLYVQSEFKVDINVNNDNKVTIGIGNASVFGKPTVIPIINYYYKYSDKINFSLGFPETVINYSNSVRNNFYLKSGFNGSFYSLDNSAKSVFVTSTKSSFSQMTASLEYERKIDTNWLVNLKAGYDFNRKYLLVDDHYNTTHDFSIKDGFNLGITIKYKQ